MSDKTTQEAKSIPSPVPNPGSDSAIEAGCSCPVMDNGRGRGWKGQPGIFVFTGGCPVHHLEAIDDAL